ncbi:MAG: SRPBCC family protein [Fibrobacteria bacterium]
MRNEHVSKASVTIQAAVPLVWDALVNPEKIKQYMLGSDAESDWRVGSEITWSGVWQGKAYRDKGVILRLEPNKLLEYSHYSPLSGKPDDPANYHTVTIELADQGEVTLVALSQDNNASEKEQDGTTRNWETILQGLRDLLERKPETLQKV